jgi:dTDP-4-amino-4,6-dideoxygalactose transaminase
MQIKHPLNQLITIINLFRSIILKNEKLATLGGTPVIDANIKHIEWPRRNKDMEEAVLKQLYDSISIYDRSGIFLEFENKFSKYHDIQYSLLSNSGTSAIFSMFEGISLTPDDEIICPVYTFFATISPIVYSGAKIVFCDCNEDGNIDTKEIENKITDKTKAIIITHMWGIPCDMEKIVEICDKNNLLLLEDCSHAHGAKYKGKKVGSFGDASAWSLQGQKIITGGEGGIMLTKHKEIYERALLQGHYNKRCRQEIDSSSELYDYATTGFGLKLRAHPLAICIANHQFDFLDEWLEQKNKYAEMLISELSVYPFLTPPKYSSDKRPSWYAYVMQFNSKFSNGVTIDEFVNALHAEGLKEVDRPGSTSPLDKFPLFTRTQKVMGRLYQEPASQSKDSFINAYKFYNNAIKIPIWAFEDEDWIVKSYIKGFHKVCNAVINQPNSIKRSKK